MGVVCKGCVTWPGDTRPKGKFPRARLQARSLRAAPPCAPAPARPAAFCSFRLTPPVVSNPLQEDHTHLVMLDTDDAGAATPYRFALTSALMSCAQAQSAPATRAVPSQYSRLQPDDGAARPKKETLRGGPPRVI